MIKFEVVRAHEMFSTFLDTIEAHHDEVEDKHFKFSPNIPWYYKMEDEGSLIITAVKDDDVVVGYSLDLLMDHPHYSGKLFAVNDGIYLKEEYRHLGLMTQLLDHVTQTLLSFDVAHHTVALKSSNPCSHLMTELGYQTPEVSWMKRLKV